MTGRLVKICCSPTDRSIVLCSFYHYYANMLCFLSHALQALHSHVTAFLSKLHGVQAISREHEQSIIHILAAW